MGRLCDGVEAVRYAARDELRQGANFIKVMANGGIASPSDPIHMLQFSRAELLAAVEEAVNYGTYVSAHLYTDGDPPGGGMRRPFAGALQPDPV